jgi:hypothetical protein
VTEPKKEEGKKGKDLNKSENKRTQLYWDILN